jgi:hypothetical protein
MGGPWLPVLADDDGFVYPTVKDAVEALGEGEEVRISVVRGTATPTDRNGTTGVLLRLPGSYHAGDVACDVEAFLVDPDDESTGAHARYEQAKAMAAGLNAARGHCQNCQTDLPRGELRMGNLGGPADDDPDLLVCLDVHACQVRAGEVGAEDRA